jgi:hypothetical protein
LSIFSFGDDFRARADDWGIVDTKGFRGTCWAPWLWWDIDRDNDLDQALVDARRLAAHLLERFPTLDVDALLVFYSGFKGFHVGVPTSLWQPEPSVLFNQTTRRFATLIAEQAGVSVYDPKRGHRIDEGIYDQVRAFRAPNSKHPKSGCYKRRLSFDELLGLTLDRMRQIAHQPEPFDLPPPAGPSEQAAAAWREAEDWVRRQADEKVQRCAAGKSSPHLNQITRDFIAHGAERGDRHRLLFSAAADLAEHGCPPDLAHALLTESALDSGLSPAEVRRQIDCGLAHGAKVGNASASPTSDASSESSGLAEPAVPRSDPATIQGQLAALWASTSGPPPAHEAINGVAASGATPAHGDTPHLAQVAASTAPVADAADVEKQVAALWNAPPADAGDAWESEQDRREAGQHDFPFGANLTGPYGPGGERR